MSFWADGIVKPLGIGKLVLEISNEDGTLDFPLLEITDGGGPLDLPFLDINDGGGTVKLSGLQPFDGGRTVDFPSELASMIKLGFFILEELTSFSKLITLSFLVLK